MRFGRIMNSVGEKPLKFIEIILALGVIILALYAMSPTYHAVPSTAIGNAIQSAFSRYGYGFTVLLGGVVSLWGLKIDSLRLRSYGSFWIFLTFCFLTLIRIIVVGLVPLVWLWTFMLALIAAVIHVRINWERE